MKSDEQFIKDLEASRRKVNEFAALQRQKGIQIWLPPQCTRPDSSKRMEYMDDGDMMVQMRVEHKSISLEFTCKKDIKMDYMIVDEKYKFDQKNDTPVLMYVLQSANKTHAAIVYGYTREHWVEKEIYDGNQKRKCVMYMCPLTYIRVCKIENVLY